MNEREALRRLEALQAVTDAALAHLSLDSLLDELLLRIRALLDADTAAILMLDEARQRLVARAAKGLEEEVERGVEIPVGRGFAGRIAAERRPVKIDDVDHADILNPLLREKGVRSLLGVPLLVQGRIIGVLHVGTLVERRFTASDEDLLQAVGDRAALAIEHARAYDAERRAREDAQQAAERLERLQNVTDAALAHLGLDALLGELLGRIRALLDADTVAVLLLDEPGDVLIPRGATGLEGEVESGIRIPVGAGFAGRIAAERRPLALADIRDADIFNPLLREKGIRSLLGVPLLVEGRVTGVAHVGTLTPRNFSQADVELLQAVADRAALAIEHARVYEGERNARREAERRASAALALDYIGDGVFLLDRNRVIRFWNPAAELIVGVPIEAALGRRIDDIAPGWAKIEAAVPVARFPAPAATLATTLPLEVEGAERWLSISGVSFRDGRVYAFRDLTDQRRLEEWQSEFIATVAHEFRTPMASIYGAAATLRRQDVRLSDETRDSLLSIVYHESERLARLVDDVLVASRLEAGKLNLSVRHFDAADVARRVIEAARAHVMGPVEITLATPGETPPVAGDPDKVKHVLVNLVENAVKYSPHGGKVEVRLEPHARHIRFAVADEGLGIPQHEAENVFRKFYRLESHAEQGIGGTGLGLYICQELVNRMDGRIWVSSTEGKGSTFYFELPLAGENGSSDAGRVGTASA